MDNFKLDLECGHLEKDEVKKFKRDYKNRFNVKFDYTIVVIGTIILGGVFLVKGKMLSVGFLKSICRLWKLILMIWTKNLIVNF